jgi:hypothetical protein
MQNRQLHQPEVQAYLQKQFSSRRWKFTLPHGYGNESYFVSGNGQTYFVKLGVPVANYQAMASIGLAPSVIASGFLEDGTSLLVQPYITGRTPYRKDYRDNLEKFATMINQMHHNLEVRCVLPEAPSDQYSVLAYQSLTRVHHRWNLFKAQVPTNGCVGG